MSVLISSSLIVDALKRQNVKALNCRGVVELHHDIFRQWEGEIHLRLISKFQL